ncbi:uncharacterized protein LOC136031641 isoform X3 [Artemia franciscana]|uniref:uncharacterized protein LOC136031641 isoform X3 n=1 Tax=Artemia franciscana TaxID=6661 RepID=UPI0032DA6FBC
MLRQHSEDHICTYVSGNTLVLVSPSRETDSLALICLTNSEAMLCRSHENKDRLPFILNMLGSAYNTKLPLEMNQQISLSRKNNSGKEDKTKLVAKLLVRLGKEFFLNQMQRQLPQGQIYPYIIEDAFIAVNQGTKIGVCTNAEAKLYRSQRKRDYLTHIFTIAQTTYQSTLLPTISQCICLPVESESWKTESANFWMMHRAGMRKENLREFSQIDNYFKLGFESPEIRSKYQMPQGKVILGDIESKEYRNLNNIKDAKKIDVTKDTKEEATGFLQKAKSKFKINHNLVLLKCALFLYFGGMAAVSPYYAVHMRSIGLSIEEIGTISACLPFAALIGAPIAGMLSDKLGQYRYVLMGALITAIISQTCVLMADARVPDSFETHTASAILFTVKNEPHLKVLHNSWNSSRLLSSAKLMASSIEGCMEREEPFHFYPTEEDRSALTANATKEKEAVFVGNTDIDISDCVGQTKVDIIALRFIDTERDMQYQSMHLRGFWTYFLIRVLSTAMISSCFCLFDATVLAMVKEHNGDYGKQRFFSMLGLGTISPLSGILVDWFSTLKGSRDYSVIFYLSDALLILVVFLVWKLDVKAEKSQGSFLRNLQQLVKIPEIPIFLLFMMLLGSNWGFTENYLFIFLSDELKAPTYLLGLSVTVGCLCGLPFLSISNHIIKRVGIMPMFLMAYLSYAARFIGYSFLQDPWISLALESLKFLSYHLLQCAACSFCALKAPKGLLATLTSIYGAIHYQLGRSIGAYVGGLLIPKFGLRELFRILAYVAVTVGTTYLLIDFFILRRIARRRALKEASSFLRTAKSTFKINPNLVLLKCALFLYFGGISAVNPFYTVLMRNIGLNIEEIGIISACLPFAALVGAPIAGMLSDKLGQYRYVLIGTLICAIISQTCTLFADARTPDTFESYNSSAILYNSNNKTQLRIIASNWNFTKPLSTVRFTIPNSNNSYGCVATEKPINFNVIEEKGLTLFGNADVNLTRCTSQTEVEIIALEFVDIQRDIEHRYIHLQGFWMFFIIRVIANAMTSSCFVLFDAIVLSMVKEHNGDYGKQRFFSMLGLGSISPLSGVLVDWFSSIKGSRDYSVIFYFSDVFLFIVILLVWKLDVKAEKTQGSFFKNLQKLITIPEIPVFLFFMVLLGSNWGLTDSYLFIFLTDELNAPVSLLGLSITVGCFCGLPFLSISNQIIKKVGIMPMFLLAYLAHAARFIGYSFLQDPWITLAIESLKFLSYHLLQCAACNFCSLKAPKGLLATLTSIFGVSHYHLGRSAGAYAGGLLISQYGVRESFRIFAYAAILIGTSYMLIEFFILRRVARSRALSKQFCLINFFLCVFYT